MIPKNSDQISFGIEGKDTGKRLDSFLSENISHKSRSYIQKIIESGSVKVNKKTARKNCRLNAGDIIEVRSTEVLNGEQTIIPQKIPLKVLYQDDYFLIISKEAGMTVHPAAGNYTNTLVNALLYYFKEELEGFTDMTRPGIVHRLDKDTSGVLVVAKDNESLHKLSGLFKKRLVNKSYLALVSGKFREKSGQVSLPIGRSRVDRKKMAISIDKGRESITDFKVMEEFKECSLIMVLPRTGRTHQIRVHLGYINHPIIGDEKYGSRESGNIARKIGLKRQFLHAFKISFLHPYTDKLVEVEDPLPADLKKSLELLRTDKI